MIWVTIMNCILFASEGLNILNVREGLPNGPIELICLDLTFNFSLAFAAPVGSEAAGVTA